MRDNTCVAILGGHSEELEGKLPFPSISLGYVSDDRRIADIYRSADVFVLPSLSENLPNTIMEAMACGKPVLAYGKGGALETVIPGVTGEFFYEPTIESMEDGLVAAFSSFFNFCISSFCCFNNSSLLSGMMSPAFFFRYI